MAMPPAPEGWTRLKMKSKFGAGRDFLVFDPETEEQQFYVDGHIGPKPKAEVKTVAGEVLYNVVGSMLGIPKHMTVTNAAGENVAELKAKMFSPIKTKMTMTMAEGEPWHLEGEIFEKNYSIESQGQPIVAITQKWVTVRDSYTLDVAAGIDPALALAVVWAVDRWVERD
jgi:uncharacterized protein YxjI